MNAFFLVIVGFCLIGLAIRTTYELLKKAGKVDPKSKVVFAVVFVAMCLMLLSWPFLGPLDPLPLTLPDIVRWAGLVVAVAGLALAVGGLIQLKGFENIDHLVTHGLFSKLRHPMYTGFMLWILGWVIYYGAAVSLAVGLVCIANILYWRWLEEQKLADQFGEDYRRYRTDTWF
jgi:protein-S-isoprenylcysteine O-methyltransferase Ste14